MRTDYLFNHLNEAILGYKKDTPILVAIDGVDASGKTTFADKFDRIFEPKNEGHLWSAP